MTPSFNTIADSLSERLKAVLSRHLQDHHWHLFHFVACDCTKICYFRENNFLSESVHLCPHALNFELSVDSDSGWCLWIVIVDGVCG